MEISNFKTVHQKTVLIIFLLLGFSLKPYAQFYYNDIVSGQQSQQVYLAIKNNNTSHVSAKCFDEYNEPVENFIFERNILNNSSRIETTMHFAGLDTTYSASLYANNILQTNTDSSSTIITKTFYTYNVDGTISSIKILTDDHFMEAQNEELHQWFYTAEKPNYMLRIKDKIDTTTVSFITDDIGNIGEEIWRKKNRIIEHYFYYYNTNNQLTDIVRYNTTAKQMLPDFLLEYATTGMVFSLTEIPQGSSAYTTWQYIYDTAGLKQSDMLFDKEKQLIGRINYYYK